MKNIIIQLFRFDRLVIQRVPDIGVTALLNAVMGRKVKKTLFFKHPENKLFGRCGWFGYLKVLHTTYFINFGGVTFD